MLVALEKLYLKKLKIILQSNFFYFFLFISVFFFVFVKTKIFTYSSNFFDDTKKIVAIITAFKIDGDKVSFSLKERENFIGSYYLKSEEEKDYLEKNLKLGMTVELVGAKQNLLDNTIPNTFNYKKYLYNKQIYFSFLIEKITILNKKVSWSNNLKNMVVKRIQNLGNNCYIQAFILGDKSLMQQEVQEKFKDNGVSHLFALSGMHLSFISIFLDKLLKKIKKRKIFIYSFLLIYLVLTSFPISFIRAILFTGFIDLNKKWKMGISNSKILFLIACFLLVYNPFFIYDMGFLYTFVVTFSLLFCHDLLQRKNKITQIMVVSLITFLFSAPITIYNNYEINLFSIINNIVLIPFISAIVFPFAIISFLLPFFLPIFMFIVYILEWLNTILSFFSYFLVIGKITLFEVFFYYLLISLILKLRLKFCVVVFFFYMIFLYNKDIFTFYSSVYYLDVSQGDSTLLVAPQNKEVILIDTGGKIEYEKKEWQVREKEYNLAEIMLQFLKSKRIRKINLLMLTHGDLDHVGYANYIANSIKIDKVMVNQDGMNSYEKEITNKILKIKKYDDNYLKYQNLETKLYDNENDNSLISYFQIDNLSFLFLGDASKKVERDLLQKYNLQAQFLKVGHHGSNTSSSEEFIKKVKPKYAIISAGRNNRYHHPSKETLATLNKLNITILNTQELGTIEIRIKQNIYRIIPTLA